MSDKSTVTVKARGGPDEEDWLYGDVDEEKAEDESPGSAAAGSTPKEVHGSGVETEETGQNDADSDNDSDDDDICVTIGDIKSGGSSQDTGFGSSTVDLNVKAEGRTHAVVGSKPKGVDVDSLGSIQGVPGLEVDVESFEEKPWRRPGADISDYFNYSFNEDTWKAYCEKQRRIRVNKESTSSKIMVQQGRTGHGDEEARCDYTLSGSLFRPRKSSGTIDVIGGQTGSISRTEGRRRHSNEGNNIQVLSEASSDGDSSANKISSFFPPHIPPPPFLTPPPSISSAPPLIPPPRFPLPPGVPPPPSLMATLDSGRYGGHDQPPISPYPYPPGMYPLLLGSMAPWAGVMENAKAWEYYARQDREHEKGRDRSREREKGRDRSREQEKGRDRSRDRETGRDRSREQEKGRDGSREQEKGRDQSREQEKGRDGFREQEKGRDRSREQEKGRDRSREQEKDRDRSREQEKGRDRSRERGHDEDRERGRDGEREHSPSSQALNSEEESQRHREHGERGYELHGDGSSREREERYREERYREERYREERYREERERGYELHGDGSSREREERYREERYREERYREERYREEKCREERYREERHRDKDQGRYRHACSSSRRRRHDREEGDGHRRHKHKRTKRRREDNETSHELSGDQENQSDPRE